MRDREAGRRVRLDVGRLVSRRDGMGGAVEGFQRWGSRSTSCSRGVLGSRRRTSTRYVNGSTLFILQEAMKLKWIAAASPPRSLPTMRQFLRPMAMPRWPRSASGQVSDRYIWRYTQPSRDDIRDAAEELWD